MKAGLISSSSAPSLHGSSSPGNKGPNQEQVCRNLNAQRHQSNQGLQQCHVTRLLHGATPLDASGVLLLNLFLLTLHTAGLAAQIGLFWLLCSDYMSKCGWLLGSGLKNAVWTLFCERG